MTSNSLTPQEIELLLEAKRIHDELGAIQARVAPAKRMAQKADRLIKKFEENYGINIRNPSTFSNLIPASLGRKATDDLEEITRLNKAANEIMEAVMAEFGTEGD